MRDYFSMMHGWTQSLCINEQGQKRMAMGFIQPLSTTKPERPYLPGSAGVHDHRRYLLIAPPEAIVYGGRGITVEAEGKEYELLRCELLGGGSHWEGIMKLKAGGENAG